MKEMKTLTFPSGDTYEIVDAQNREDLANLIEVEEKPEIEIPTMEDLNKKTEKVQIDYMGNKVFKLGEQTLNYKQLHDIHLVSPDFAFIQYGDRAYLLSYVQDDPAYMREMRFESVIATTDANLSFVKTSGIYVKSSDGINIAGVDLTDINSENKAYKATVIDDSHKNDVWYPTVKAVADYVDPTNDAVDRLSESITEISEELYGSKNYLENKNLGMDGTTSDSDKYCVSDLIDVSDVSGIIYFYTGVSADRLFGVEYDENGAVVDFWGKNETQEYRTFEKTSRTKNFRFAFVKGTNAFVSIGNASGNKIYTAGETGGIADDVESIKTSISSDATVYNVGKGYALKTIKEAINKWSADGRPVATVYVAKGEYNEPISLPAKSNIAFVGECRENTIVRTKSGIYEDAPFTIRHGNVNIENMTIIADHTDNPNFDYSQRPDSYLCAYGVHIDSGNNDGEYCQVTVRNCTVKSYQAPAFGLGTIANSCIRIENCDAYCYTDNYTEYPFAENVYDYGAFLYHTSSDNSEANKNERLELINTRVYTKNTRRVFYYRKATTKAQDLLCDNVRLSSDHVSPVLIQKIGYADSEGKFFVLDKLSYGNMVSELNT